MTFPRSHWERSLLGRWVAGAQEGVTPGLPCEEPVRVWGLGCHSPGVQWPQALGEQPWVGNGQCGMGSTLISEGNPREAVPHLGPHSSQTVPFRGWSPGGAVWQMSRGRCHALMWPRRLTRPASALVCVCVTTAPLVPDRSGSQGLSWPTQPGGAQRPLPSTWH